MSGNYVLIADDNEFFPKLLQGELEKLGYNVMIVPDGESAIEQIKKDTPFLLLLDLIMPKVNGFDVLEELNNLKIIDKISVLVFSNLSQDEDIKRVKELGAVDYIVKQDLSLADVISKIRAIIKN